eukprot:295504_1
MATRLFIKNLPKSLSSDQLRDHFEKIGEVTDAKVLTKNGRSRKIGFVGYKTESEAKRAIKHLDNSYIGSTRLSVELAAERGNVRSRPWSKYSKGSSAYSRSNPKSVKPKSTPTNEYPAHSEHPAQSSNEHPTQSANEHPTQSATEHDLERARDDTQLREFLNVMKPRSGARAWGNDDGATEQKESKPTENPENASDSDSDMNDTIVDSENNAKKKKKSDLDYFKSKTVPAADSDSSESDDGSSSSGSDSDEMDSSDDLAAEVNPTEEHKSESCTEETPDSGDVPDLADSGRLLVRNLPFSATEEEVEELFKKFGDIAEVHIPLDDFKRSKGFCYVQFEFPGHAVKASEALDGKPFQGRLLHILASRQQPKQPDLDDLPDDSLDSITFKKKRDLKRRKEAGKQPDTWNSLFMRADTVAAAVANKLGVKKSEILDVDGDGSMAVKLALGETRTIEETKSFLDENGVNPKAFEGKRKGTVRSKRVILAKNLPFSAEPNELREMFERFGTLGRVLIPPSRAIAVVEFLESSEAKAAFRHLAFRKFKHVPLYLEWAPQAAFIDSFGDFKSKNKAEKKKEQKEKQETGADYSMDVEEEGDDEFRTIFVKNLNFESSEKTLRKVFEVIGPLNSVTIKTKPNLKYDPDPGAKGDFAKKVLSMGYGFVEFRFAKDAAKAIKQMQGVKVDDHKLQLKPSRHTSAPKAKKKRSAGDRSETKLTVKNLAFEATVREIRQLFGAYGSIKSCRLPKKFGGGHRGFAFVEFVTKQEAKNAFEALANTHLYGRHLVLEWAKREEGVEQIREKTRKQFEGHTESESKRRRLDKVDEFSSKAIDSYFGESNL